MSARAVSTRFADPLSPRSLVLWIGVLGPPLAWATNLVLGDLIFELGCGPAVRGREILGLSLKAWSLIESAVLLAATVAAGMLAYLALRRLRGVDGGTAAGRARALAMAGVASSCLYGLIIVYGTLAPFLLHTCQRSL